MKKYFVYIASAVLMMAACAKEEVNTPVVETELITVELNAATKTALSTDGKNTTWSTGDKVSVTVGTENIGTLTLVEGNTFRGNVKAGREGKAILNYPVDNNGNAVTTVPSSQAAVAKSFANGAALLEGETTMADLRAGRGATLDNKTALLKFTVAEAGDVTFEVGSTKYTVTGCKTGNTYYACVAPASNVSFVARIGGYLSKKASSNKTFTVGKIADLGVLPAPETSTWGLVGQHQGWSLTSAKITKMFKEDVNLFVVKNIKLQSTGFKFTEVTNTDWNKTFGTHDGGNYNNVGYWYAGIYTNNRDNKDKDIKVSNYSKTYDIYLRFVQDASWGKELGFVVVDAGQNYPTY